MVVKETIHYGLSTLKKKKKTILLKKQSLPGFEPETSLVPTRYATN